jgi:hypothetical protein
LTSKDINNDVGSHPATAEPGKAVDEAARKELERIHEHADPSKGGKTVKGGDRIKITDGRKHGSPDAQATKA